MTVQNITSDANLVGLHDISSVAPCVISGSQASSASSGPSLALSAFTPPSFPAPSPASLSPLPCHVTSANGLFADLCALHHRESSRGKAVPSSERSLIALLVNHRTRERTLGSFGTSCLTREFVTSEQVLLLPEDVLSVIGYMGQATGKNPSAIMPDVLFCPLWDSEATTRNQKYCR